MGQAIRLDRGDGLHLCHLTQIATERTLREEYIPFTIGNRFRILPPDVTVQPADRINLIMDRGAFGSGEHETTRSCLECLEKLPRVTGTKVLDLGSGTGILSIAALKLGAEQAYCVDIEEAAVVACQRNCRQNGVEPNVYQCCGTLDRLSEHDFDLILANIYGDVLIDVASDLVARAKPGARLLLSGILWEYNFDVRQSYERLGCTLIRNQILEEFSTVLLKKAETRD